MAIIALGFAHTFVPKACQGKHPENGFNCPYRHTRNTGHQYQNQQGSQPGSDKGGEQSGRSDTGIELSNVISRLLQKRKERALQ
jgi:hypothetical protein